MSIAGSRSETAATAIGLRSDLAFLLVAFVASRIAILGVAALASAFAPSGPGESLASALCSWDCHWYVGIVEGGYSGPTEVRADGLANWAFFPLLPLMVRGLVDLTGGDIVVVALLAANLLAAAGLCLFHALTRDLFGRDFARFAAVVFAVWPFAVHQAVPMSEAAFVPLSLAALVAARRGAWLVAGLAAALLGATRAVGVLVVLPLFLLAMERHGLMRLVRLRPGTERAVLALMLCGLGLGLFMVHLHDRVGDALAFSHDQTAWNRRFVWPWLMVWDTVAANLGAPDDLAVHLAIFAVVVAALAGAVVLWRRGLVPEAVFTAAPLVIALHSGSSMSLPRFVGALAPLTLALALVADRPGLRIPVVALSAVAQGFVTWGWVREWFYVM
jgi:hypothetical protein